MCIDGDVYMSAEVMFELESADGSSSLLRNAVGLHTELKLLGV